MIARAANGEPVEVATPIVVELPKPLPMTLLVAVVQARPFKPFRLDIYDDDPVEVTTPRQLRLMRPRHGGQPKLLIQNPDTGDRRTVYWPHVKKIVVRDEA
jgi:hypothetical protein